MAANKLLRNSAISPNQETIASANKLFFTFPKFLVSQRSAER